MIVFNDASRVNDNVVVELLQAQRIIKNAIEKIHVNEQQRIPHNIVALTQTLHILQSSANKIHELIQLHERNP